MRHILFLAICASLVLAPLFAHAQNDGVLIEATQTADATGAEARAKAPDPSIAKKLNLMGTPFTVDDDGDYRILVKIDDERSQLVWVRSVVNETDALRLREIWTYGLRSDERRIPAHIANRLLSENMDLIVGAWARQQGNAVLILKINADADADTLDEAIDLAASIGDRMEQRLVSGDDL